jgi:hypothetical protein
MSTNGNWLQRAGEAVLHGIEWLASPNGQKVVSAGEVAVEVAFPPSAPVIAIVNAWLTRITTVQAKATAAADLGATATNEQKAAAAIAAVTPDVEAILQQYKLLPLTPAQYKAINDAVVTIATTLVPAAVPAA